MAKAEMSYLTAAIIVLIAVVVVYGAVFSHNMEGFLVFLDDLVHVMLPLAEHLLELIGGVVIFFGSAITFIWFMKSKLKNPYQPSRVIPHFARYLTLSLEFFIGAEIIKTAIAKTWDEFLLLILVIMGRGVLGIILHYEAKWSEAEAQSPHLE